MERIAVFGGSFDPVHTEHIHLAKSAVESLRLNKLFVMPAYAPPHKKGKILSSDEDRLALCRLAFADEPKIEVSDYEISRGGTSYTYLTCQYFREKYPSAEIFWLVGTDMLRDFPTWKNPQEILRCVKLAVCARNEKQGWIEKEQADFYARFHTEFSVIGYEGAEVSSTEIRVLAGAGMDITPFVGEKVAEYIQQKRLYEIIGAKEALALEKPSRVAHSIRVAKLSASRAVALGISEKKAIEASLFHDCGKNLAENSPLLKDFEIPMEWGEVPSAVVHQFTGAYLAEKVFGVRDTEVLNAIRYHTSARPNMGELEKLVFLADMLEEERNYEGVEELRALFYAKKEGLDDCLLEALFQTLLFLEKKGGQVYSLTQKAYEYYKKQKEYQNGRSDE